MRCRRMDSDLRIYYHSFQIFFSRFFLRSQWLQPKIRAGSVVKFTGSIACFARFDVLFVVARVCLQTENNPRLKLRDNAATC